MIVAEATGAYRNISVSKSNSAALIVELCEITCFASLRDATGNDVVVSAGEEGEAPPQLDLVDDDDDDEAAVFIALLAAAFSMGL